MVRIACRGSWCCLVLMWRHVRRVSPSRFWVPYRRRCGQPRYARPEIVGERFLASEIGNISIIAHVACVLDQRRHVFGVLIAAPDPHDCREFVPGLVAQSRDASVEAAREPLRVPALLAA